MMKGSIQEEDITTVNTYAPNIGEPKYIRQILTNIKGEIDSNTIIVGDLKLCLHKWTDHPERKSIRKHWDRGHIRSDELNRCNGTFHLKAAEYTFFSKAHRTFSRMDHMLDHKTSLGKFKKIETISSTFSNQNAMRLGINYKKKKNCKKHKHVEAKHYAIKQPIDH